MQVNIEHIRQQIQPLGYDIVRTDKVPMTPREKKLYDLMAMHSDVSPSYEQMMGWLGLKSRSNIHRMVHSMIEKGWLKHTPGKKRSLRVCR